MPDDIKLPEPAFRLKWTDSGYKVDKPDIGDTDVYTADQLRNAVLVDRAGRWQPIETAPRDGSYFLAANQWGVWVCQYEPQARSGYVFENPWHSVMLNHAHIDERVRGNRPTHWQPLPAPPEQEPT